jgi:hypothetical protein
MRGRDSPDESYSDASALDAMVKKGEVLADAGLRHSQRKPPGRPIPWRSFGFYETGRLAMRCDPSLICPNSKDGKSSPISKSFRTNEQPADTPDARARREQDLCQLVLDGVHTKVSSRIRQVIGENVLFHQESSYR